MSYAFDEFQTLVPKIEADKKAYVYLSALISELSYYAIEEGELDGLFKRAKLIVPSSGFRRLVGRKQITNIATAIGDRDDQIFVVSTKNIVAVTIIIQNKVFIGYRGTRFSFDWGINLETTPTSFDGLYNNIWPASLQFHKGFAEEAIRINILIKERLKSLQMLHPDHFYLSGHSLGGAIAAISTFMLEAKKGPTTAVTFGAPRYATIRHFFANHEIIPTQIQRHGDITPYVPPKALGYMDHPLAYKPDGTRVTNRYGDYISLMVWRASKFIVKLASYHDMEKYRQDCGKEYGSAYCDDELIDNRKL